MENDPILEGKNTGFIEVAPRAMDFVAGEESGIAAIERLPSGDWRPYYPSDEWQKLLGVKYLGGNGFDTLSCVSFSANNVVEMYANYCLTNNLWPEELVLWLRERGYIDPSGKLNLSDRFTAKVSGTTKNGNSLPAVWDAIRNFGAVPESVWPFPVNEIKESPDSAWETFFRDIPQDVLDLGLEFKKRLLVQYEWSAYPGSGATPASFARMLRVAPLQIATAVCSPWNTSELILACGAGTGHATTMGHVDPMTSYDIYDHYDPFRKRFALDYTITYAVRGMISPQPAVVAPPAFRYTFTKPLSFGNGGNDPRELKALQTALQTIKDPMGKPYMKVGVFGPYGPQTADALLRFQLDHKVSSRIELLELKGYSFGPKSRAVLTAVLNK